MIYQKQLENVGYFNYFDGKIKKITQAVHVKLNPGLPRQSCIQKEEEEEEEEEEEASFHQQIKTKI